jgi:hypothetical protein
VGTKTHINLPISFKTESVYYSKVDVPDGTNPKEYSS